jgi:predicted DNA-binding transcriptional regulator AlpA
MEEALDIPAEQLTRFEPRRSKKPKSLQTTPTSPLLVQDHVPDDDEDDDDSTVPAYVRFADLREAKIASSWPQLYRLIAEQGFPPGIWLSPNVRVFAVAEVRRWLASRPVPNNT